MQFDCTCFADVNPKVHAYARGKGKHLAVAVDLLRRFVEQVWAFEEQDQEPMPTRQFDIWKVLDLRQYKTHLPTSCGSIANMRTCGLCQTTATP